MEWLDRLAEALGEEPLSAQERERLLRAARDVAHRVERRATPLAAYLVGIAVGRGLASDRPREAAFDEAIDAVIVRLPDGPETPEADEGRSRGPG
jgi:Domain of unknown function (DUF6457)